MWILLSSFFLISCDNSSLIFSVSPQNASGGVDGRAEFIKDYIEKNKEWGGGHSIFPRKVVNFNTYRKALKWVSVKDVDALMLLLQDDATDIRIAAAVLFECVVPAAKDKITERINKESDILKKDRLGEALLLIDVMRAGGTTCK